MTTDINEIRSFLCSEKITIRKNGRKLCEQEIIAKNIPLSNHETIIILQAMIEYETKELDALFSKDKKLVYDIPQFFCKALLRHCMKYGNLSTFILLKLIEHHMFILYHPQMDDLYTSYHKILLLELLEYRQMYGLPYYDKDLKVGLHVIITYLREQMIDKKRIQEIIHLKLCKSICSLLFLDLHEHYDSIVGLLFDWFEELCLLIHKYEEYNQNMMVLTTIFDGYTCLLNYSTLNCYSILLVTSSLPLEASSEAYLDGKTSSNTPLEPSKGDKSSKSMSQTSILLLFELLLRHMFTHGIRETQFESFQWFLYSFLTHILTFPTLLQTSLLMNHTTKLYTMAQQILTEMLSEDYLMNILQLSKKRQPKRFLASNKESYVNYLLDSRVQFAYLLIGQLIQFVKLLETMITQDVHTLIPSSNELVEPLESTTKRTKLYHISTTINSTNPTKSAYSANSKDSKKLKNSKISLLSLFGSIRKYIIIDEKPGKEMILLIKRNEYPMIESICLLISLLLQEYSYNQLFYSIEEVFSWCCLLLEYWKHIHLEDKTILFVLIQVTNAFFLFLNKYSEIIQQENMSIFQEIIIQIECFYQYFGTLYHSIQHIYNTPIILHTSYLISDLLTLYQFGLTFPTLSIHCKQSLFHGLLSWKALSEGNLTYSINYISFICPFLEQNPYESEYQQIFQYYLSQTIPQEFEQIYQEQQILQKLQNLITPTYIHSLSYTILSSYFLSILQHCLDSMNKTSNYSLFLSSNNNNSESIVQHIQYIHYVWYHMLSIPTNNHTSLNNLLNPPVQPSTSSSSSASSSSSCHKLMRLWYEMKHLSVLYDAQSLFVQETASTTSTNPNTSTASSSSSKSKETCSKTSPIIQFTSDVHFTLEQIQHIQAYLQVFILLWTESMQKYTNTNSNPTNLTEVNDSLHGLYYLGIVLYTLSLSLLQLSNVSLSSMQYSTIFWQQSQDILSILLQSWYQKISIQHFRWIGQYIQCILQQLNLFVKTIPLNKPTFQPKYTFNEHICQCLQSIQNWCQGGSNVPSSRGTFTTNKPGFLSPNRSISQENSVSWGTRPTQPPSSTLNNNTNNNSSFIDLDDDFMDIDRSFGNNSMSKSTDRTSNTHNNTNETNNNSNNNLNNNINGLDNKISYQQQLFSDYLDLFFHITCLLDQFSNNYKQFSFVHISTILLPKQINNLPIQPLNRSEFIILFCYRLITINQFELVRQLIDTTSWHIELSHYGYLLLLSMIQQYLLQSTSSIASCTCHNYLQSQYNSSSSPTSSSSLQVISQVSSGGNNLPQTSQSAPTINTLEYILQLILPLEEDDILETFQQQLVFIRIVQLDCIAILLSTLSDISSIKSLITRLFMKLMSDSDLRVRYFASKYSYLLFKHFTKLNSVYDSLFKAHQITKQTITSEELLVNPLSMAILYTMMIQMCQPMSPILQNILGDLIDILANRILAPILFLNQSKFSKNSTEEQALVQHTKLRIQSYAMVHQRLLTIILSLLCHQLSYSTVYILIQDYQSFFFFRWFGSFNHIVYHSNQRTNPKTSEPFYPYNPEEYEIFWRSIPIEFFYQDSQSMNISKETLIQQSKEFLLPIIIQLSPSTLRWNILQSYLTCLSLINNDNNIKKIILDHFLSIKALESIRQSMYQLSQTTPSLLDSTPSRMSSNSSPSSSLSTIMSVSEIQQFLLRMVSTEQEYILLCQQDFTTIVLYVLDIFTQQSMDVTSPPMISSVILLETIFQYLNHHIYHQPTLTLLFTRCNWLFIFSYLHTRLSESQLSFTIQVMHDLLTILMQYSIELFDNIAIIRSLYLMIVMLQSSSSYCTQRFQLIQLIYQLIQQKLLSFQALSTASSTSSAKKQRSKPTNSILDEKQTILSIHHYSMYMELLFVSYRWLYSYQQMDLTSDSSTTLSISSTSPSSSSSSSSSELFLQYLFTQPANFVKTQGTSSTANSSYKTPSITPEIPEEYLRNLHQYHQNILELCGLIPNNEMLLYGYSLGQIMLQTTSTKSKQDFFTQSIDKIFVIHIDSLIEHLQLVKYEKNIHGYLFVMLLFMDQYSIELTKAFMDPLFLINSITFPEKISCIIQSLLEICQLLFQNPISIQPKPQTTSQSPVTSSVSTTNTFFQQLITRILSCLSQWENHFQHRCIEKNCSWYQNQEQLLITAIHELYLMTWNPMYTKLALSTLSYLSDYTFFQDIFQLKSLATTSNSLTSQTILLTSIQPFVQHHIQYQLQSWSSLLASILPKEITMLSYPSQQQSQGLSQQQFSQSLSQAYTNSLDTHIFWSEELWCQEIDINLGFQGGNRLHSITKPYDQWITRFTSEAIQYIICLLKQKKFPNLDFVTQQILTFCQTSLLLCSSSSSYAQVIYPLIIYALIKVSSTNPMVIDRLSTRIQTYCLGDKCYYVHIKRLTCQTLYMLLRQNIMDYQQDSLTNSIFVNPKQMLSSQGIDPNTLVTDDLPYSFILNIDFLTLSQASIQVHLYATALLFLELAYERLKQQSASSTSTSSSSSSTQTSFVDSKLRSTPEYQQISKQLLIIFQGLQEMDAIDGLNLSSDLYLQAINCQSKGKWIESLLTYESLLSSSTAKEEYSVEIMHALEGLGAHHTKEHIQETLTHKLTTMNQFAGQELSQWSLTTSSTTPNIPQHTSIQGKLPLQFVSQLTSSSTYDSHHHTSLNLHQTIQSTISTFEKTICSVEFVKTLHSFQQECLYKSIEDISQEKVLLPENSLRIYYFDLYSNLSSLNQLLMTSTMTNTQMMNIFDQISQQIVKQFKETNSFHHQQTYKHTLPIEILGRLIQNKRITSSSMVLYASKLLAPLLQVLDDNNQTLSYTWSPLFIQYWSSFQQYLDETTSTPLLNPLTKPEKSFISLILQCQSSELLWKKGYRGQAVRSMHSEVILPLSQLYKVTSTQEKQTWTFRELQNLFSYSLTLYGKWLHYSGTKSFQKILENYLKPAIDYAKATNIKIQAMQIVAMQASEMYYTLLSKIQSNEWKLNERMLQDLEEELKQSLEIQNNPLISNQFTPEENRQLLRHITTLQKEITADKQERQEVLSSIDMNLSLAIEKYGQILQYSDESDLEIVFKLIHLWFTNNNKHHINELIGNMLQHINSSKFVPLHYQIFSRLGSNPVMNDPQTMPSTGLTSLNQPQSYDNSSNNASNILLNASNTPNTSNFQTVLMKLVVKLCQDHPYCTLYQLFALKHEHEHVDSSLYKSNVSMQRCQQAEEIYRQLIATAGTSTLTADILESIRKSLIAYINLAKTSTEVFHKSAKFKDITFKEIQGRGQELFPLMMKSTPIPPPMITKATPVNYLKQYSDVITTIECKNTFDITENGISRPKIITVLGNNGKFYKQLVKGGDDMRQDAVMQQVFDNINQTLLKDPQTRQRQLYIRTYRVVPTTPQTGVLEWVENTEPFGSILCDPKKGLHKRYYPQDWSLNTCRDHIRHTKDNHMKEKLYKEICQHFHPVFHYFFLEKFSDPMQWITNRMKYIRSVSTNSITGYILGIGDRHSYNILIDITTGEVVHIDFGIVFEQGKGLATPETVPFRLTRDIVDGFGILGCEGTFRRCCEEVMRVLRLNHTNLLTILEVIIHDPLYRWSLSPLQARMKQQQHQQQHEMISSNLQLLGKSRKTTTSKGVSLQTLSTNPSIESMIDGKGGGTTNNGAAGGATAGGGNRSSTYTKDAAERTLLRIRNKLNGYENPVGDALDIPSQVDLLINEARNPLNLCRIFHGWAPFM